MKGSLPLSFLNQRWQLRWDGTPPADLTAAFGPALARLFASRDVSTKSEADSFVDAGLHRLTDPFSLGGVERAATRIVKAVRDGERIALFGDYDADGQTSVALLARTLRDLGADVETYIPHRLDEGYGLNAPALERLVQLGCTVAITVDCGIGAHDEARWAQANGLDLIITDHHQPPETLPPAWAIVNPHLDRDFSGPVLAGVGVAFKLAEAVAELAASDRSIAHRYVELAAVGVVADVVDLRGENRSLVRAGLHRLNRDPQIPGLEALRQVAGLEGDVSAGDIGFVLGPRLNAAGRVADATLGLRLLLAPTLDEAIPLAKKLEEHNARRREIEAQALQEAEALVRESDVDQDKALVVWGSGWHPGVVGIVASRLVEKFHRPTWVVSVEGETARGSGRSVPALDLFDALLPCADLFEAYGGHAQAAGVTLPSARIDEFKRRFLQVASERLSDQDLIPALAYDDVVELADIDIPLIERLEAMQPFGAGNPAPRFVARDVVVRGRAVGRDQSHLRAEIVSADGSLRLEGIGFGMARFLERLRGEPLVDIAFVPEINAWNGRRSVSLKLHDIRLSHAANSPAALTFVAAEQTAATNERPATLRGEERVEPVNRDLASRFVDADQRLEVVDARDVDPETVFNDALLQGEGVYVIPGPSEEALAVGRRLAAISWRWRERTFFWPPSPRRQDELVEACLATRPWVVAPAAPLAPEDVSALGKKAADAVDPPLLTAIVVDLPLSPTDLVRHFEALYAWPGRCRVVLAYRRDAVRARAAKLDRIFPDRDRLVRVYVTFKALAGKSEVVTARRLFEALDRKAPRAFEPEGVAFSLEVFAELGLAREVADGWRLASEAPAKVDLEQSLRYNGGAAAREGFRRYAETLLAVPSRRFFTALFEEGSRPWI